MASSSYGVLVGTIREGEADPASDRSPHYEMWIEADGDFRAAVNIRSDDGSDLLVHVDQAFANGAALDLAGLAAGAKGFTRLATGPGGRGIDYVRGGLFDVSSMMNAPDATLAATLTAIVGRAATDPAAIALVYGRFFGDPGADAVFGFSPSQGVHDIHMMQGNRGAYAAENGVDGDGALFVRFGDGTVFALFARFDTQSVSTDPNTGAPI